MEDAVLLLLMLFVLVMASYMLGRYSCMLVSQSSFALMFGLFVGLFMIMGGKHAALHTHLNLDNSLFFNVLLPPIIYEGGFSIKCTVFFRNFPAIMSTAVLGTVIATTITGGVLYLAGVAGMVTKLSWVESFLFGTLISAVDTVATLSCFDKLNAPPLLFNLVFGESVMNDAVAIALYQTLRKWDADSNFNAKQLLRVALNTGGMFVGSLIVSAVITLGGAFLLKRRFFATLRYYPSYEISLCLIFSLLTYFVADSLKLSGIVALFFSGTMTAHYHFNTLSREAQHAFTHLLHTLAFVCENIVYVFMGTSVIMIFAGHAEENAGASLRVDDIDWSFIGLTLVACIAARFCNVFPLLSLCNCLRSPSNRIPVKYMSVIWMAGLRGSMAFALAKNWNYVGLHGASHRRLIESTTLVVILITTIVIGGLMGPLLLSLHMTGKYKDHSHLDQSDTDRNSATASESEETLSRLVQRSTRHGDDDVHGGALAFPEEEQPKANSDGTGDEVPILTPRPQFHDVISDEEDAPNLAPPVRRAAERSRGDSLTGAFFRNWQAFDTTYMQPVFGGHSQRPAAPTSVDDLAEMQLTKAQAESAV
ncbi:Sodium/hydrogen exchanger 6 [Phytophthora ramorum]|uniref:Sodium/hydrogen exchanger 6 n=1 Tax=Phytophthora ramorum TaxID=164328 RepID=UPI0030B0DAA8|nr:Sodium/hydrogen exchanger 6 [Phytophthora ramorum]